MALQFCADGLQEAAGARAIQDAMIEGEAQVHHGTHGYGIVFDNYWPFDYSVHAQNASMGLIDYWYRDYCTKCTGIIHNEGAILHVLDGELIGTSSLGNGINLLCQASQGELVGIINSWHY